MNHRLPYTGTRRKLVIAFDIGTTFSGVSYWYAMLNTTIIHVHSHLWIFSILDPGKVPEIQGVTR